MKRIPSYSPIIVAILLMEKKFLFYIVCVFLFASCKSLQVLSNKSSIEIKVGETVKLQTFDDHFIGMLTLDSVFNDSRCPVNTNCLVEGNVFLSFYLKLNDGTKTTFVVKYKQPVSDEHQIDNYTLKVEEVMPEKESGKKIKESDYGVKLFLAIIPALD